MFGIIDLASIPKDRYWLYRSLWRKDVPTLHLLPHWTWPGHEGENIPVVAYTSFNKAELFVNGVSQGFAEKAAPSGVSADPTHPQPIASDTELVRRFRLIWPDVVYEPGEIRVVAYSDDGSVAAEETVRTAGKAWALKLTPYSDTLKADGEDLCYVNVSVVDKAGNPVPCDSREVKVTVEGAGSFRAIANGDPTSLELFHLPHMHLFSGQLTTIVQSAATPGEITVKVTAKGLRPATAKIVVADK